MEDTLDRGYFMATKKDDGTMGRPIGDDETGAVMLFDDLDTVRSFAKKFEVGEGCGKLCVFAVNLVVVGEVPF